MTGFLAVPAVTFAAPAQASTSIVWSNRGQVSDGFDAVFGAGLDAQRARAVMDAAVDHWERVISALQRPLTPGDDTLEITITAENGDTPTSCGGGASGSYDALGWPTDGGAVTISGNEAVWFVDPTPNDHSEFTGAIDNAFSGEPQAGSPAAGLCDMYTVAAAEMMHILGVSSNAASRFQTGLFSTRLTFTGTTCAGPGDLWRFDGPSVTALMTSNNGGSGGSDRTVPVHVAEPCSTFGGLSGVEDAGNALFDGGRYIPSNLGTLILKDAYNYTVVMPETFGTFYATLNSTTGELLVRGGDDNNASADVITINRAGDNLAVSVDIGNDVAGVGPTDAYVSSFPAGEVRSITVDAFDGDDRVTVGAGLGIPAVVNGGSGNDMLIGSGVTINGGAGNDYITGGIAADTLNGDAGNDEIYGYEGADTLTGGDGNDVVYAADGADTFAGGAGDDQIFAGAGSNTGTDGSGNDLVDLTQNASPVGYTTGGGQDTVLGSAFNDVLTGGASADRLEGRGGNDLIVGRGGTDALFGHDGSDTFRWSEGDGADLVEGGAGESDAVEVNGSAGDDAYDVRALTSRISVSSGTTTLDLGSIEDVRVAAGDGADTTEVADLFGTEVRKVRFDGGSDAAADSVRVAGRETSELIEVAPSGMGEVAVGGFGYDVRLAGTGGEDLLRVAGNGGNDTLLASGGSGADALSVTPTGLDSVELAGVGALRVSATTVEAVQVEGRGGDDALTVVTPAGTQDVTHASGNTRDAGTVALPGLVPLRYGSLGLLGSVDIANAGGGRFDRVYVEGTALADTISIADGTGAVALNDQAVVTPTGAARLVVKGSVGDDTLVTGAGLPYTTTVLDGGDSVAGDRASLTGAAGAVALDTANATVTGYGGTISLVGIESLGTGQTGAAGTHLTVLGRGTVDDITYRPTGTRSGEVAVAGFPAGLRFDGAGGTFTIDPLGDSDKVTVVGTLADDTITGVVLPVTSIRVNALKAVSIPQATAEKISALADEGADLFDLTVFDSVAARLFVFGDMPSSKRFSENIVVRNGSAANVQYRDVKAHVFENGSIFAEYRSTGLTTRVDYEGIENLKFYR